VAFQRQIPNLRVVVAGRGEQHLEDLALQFPNVTCLGFVGVSELIGLLRGAVAMMFLSRYEGFGIPIAEAMAAGTPVIASRSSALPEVTGDAGLLVDAENTAEVVAAVKFVSGDREARLELSARGRRRAEHYRWESCVGRLLSALGGQ
jgi:glycosyltransferase involved in cell wall biosynthesis